MIGCDIRIMPPPRAVVYSVWGILRSSHYGFETAVRATIEAGVDMLVVANNSVYEEDIAARTIALIKRLVQAGNIPETRIDDSYQRIQRLKQRLQTA